MYSVPVSFSMYRYIHIYKVHLAQRLKRGLDSAFDLSARDDDSVPDRPHLEEFGGGDSVDEQEHVAEASARRLLRSARPPGSRLGGGRLRGPALWQLGFDGAPKCCGACRVDQPCYA